MRDKILSPLITQLLMIKGIEMVKVLMGILLGIAVAAAIWFLPNSVFKWVVITVVGVGLFELSRMKFEDLVERWAVILLGTMVSVVILFDLPHPAWMLALVGALFLMSMVVMWRTKQMEGSSDRLGFAALAFIYIGVAMPFWSLIHGMDQGRWLVFLAIVPACLCDTFGLIAGKTFGKHKLAPMVSPNKTVEGFIGSLVGSAVGVGAVAFIGLRGLQWWQMVVVAISIWLVSPLGDLVESMIKRCVGVKDSGTIIKGHGGALDRLDALLFVGPMMYVIAKYILRV
jgi:phosphatidate cytidylyltransferase